MVLASWNSAVWKVGCHLLPRMLAGWPGLANRHEQFGLLSGGVRAAERGHGAVGGSAVPVCDQSQMCEQLGASASLSR